MAPLDVTYKLKNKIEPMVMLSKIKSDRCVSKSSELTIYQDVPIPKTIT